MRRQGWVVTCFDFTYKQRGYYVTVTDYINSPKPDGFALVDLCFMRKTDITDSLSVPANQGGLMVEAQTLREFFGIEWAENLGDILHQFTEVFSPDAFVEGEDDQGCGGDRGDGSGIEGDVREGLEVLDQGVGPLGGSPH